jgi:hypothetical protein
VTPLYDRRGEVVAFLGPGGRIMSRSGQNIAWINSNGNVYSYSGRHLGWWDRDHMRGPDGGVVAWQAQARNLGIIPPLRSLPPLPPIPALEPIRPLPALPPLRSLNRFAWSTATLD